MLLSAETTKLNRPFYTHLVLIIRLKVRFHIYTQFFNGKESRNSLVRRHLLRARDAACAGRCPFLVLPKVLLGDSSADIWPGAEIPPGSRCWTPALLLLLVLYPVRRNIYLTTVYPVSTPESVLRSEPHWPLQGHIPGQGLMAARPHPYPVSSAVSSSGGSGHQPQIHFPTLNRGGNNCISVVLYCPPMKMFVQVNVDVAIMGSPEKGSTLGVFWPLYSSVHCLLCTVIYFST